MSDFLFGFVWTAFFTPIFIEYLISPEEQNGGADKNPFMFIFNCAFELFGLYFLICDKSFICAYFHICIMFDKIVVWKIQKFY